MTDDKAQNDGSSGPSVYCNKCGGSYPLLDCIKRNREHIVICCPNEDCGVVWQKYTARPPIAKSIKLNGKKIPPFLVVDRS